MTDTKVIKDIVEAINQSNKGTSAYDTTATVVRIEDGTAWCHIPGGVDETPVAMSVNAKPGDTVRVRVSGGQAWAMGNDSNPPTDDTTALAAQDTAIEALRDAALASAAASSAQASAESAKISAETAQTAAQQAVEDAAEAETAAAAASTAAATADSKATAAAAAASAAQSSADNANEYAARALGNLSTVQSVAETLNWIAAHGTMTLTTDTALDPTHVYFVLDANGDYTVGSATYSVVTDPDVADIGTYYELSIDESLNNYVGTHLAVTSEGLWVLPAANGYKVLIATGNGSVYTSAGTYIINENGTIVAGFGEKTQIGEVAESHAELDFHSFKLIDKEGNSYVHFSDLRDENGEYETDEIFEITNMSYQDLSPQYTVKSVKSITKNGDGTIVDPDCYEVLTGGYYIRLWTQRAGLVNGNYITVTYTTESDETKAFTLGTRRQQIGTLYKTGIYSYALGLNTAASGKYSVAIGHNAIASGNNAVSLGGTASGAGAVSLGGTASGGSSHAEGTGNASGSVSHAEGSSTATGNYSHAEGKGSGAHAEGTHAQNLYTSAYAVGQTALGTFNIPDDSPLTATETTHPSGELKYATYAVIIGNGTPGAGQGNESNAMTIDWTGNVQMYLDTSASSGTTDGDLYAAITALGWESEVIV